MELDCKNFLIIGTIISDNSFLNGTDMWLITLSLLNKVSDNAMDTNWGGVNYSKRVVASGYYNDNTRKV